MKEDALHADRIPICSNKNKVRAQRKAAPKPRFGRIGTQEKRQGFLMAVIPFIGFLTFTGFPMVLSMIISFCDLHSYDLSQMKWVGIGNYKTMFQMPLFKTALVNTLYFCLSVPINLVSQLFLANLISKPINKHFAKAARLILYIPTVIGGVAISLIWNWILEANYGVINTILTSIGMSKVGFTTTKEWFMPSVLLIKWWSTGFNILVFQSALSNVDISLKEAARIDGATDRKLFFKVVLPQISPMLVYTCTMSIIEAFGEISTMQIISGNGLGPSNSAVTLSYMMYRMAYVNIFTEGFGMASALGWVIGIITIVMVVLSNWAARKWLSSD